jgi:hypothetical protein
MSDIGLPIREYEVEQPAIPKELEEIPVPQKETERELVPVPVKK